MLHKAIPHAAIVLSQTDTSPLQLLQLHLSSGAGAGVESPKGAAGLLCEAVDEPDSVSFDELSPTIRAPDTDAAATSPPAAFPTASYRSLYPSFASFAPLNISTSLSLARDTTLTTYLLVSLTPASGLQHSSEPHLIKHFATPHLRHVATALRLYISALSTGSVLRF